MSQKKFIDPCAAEACDTLSRYLTFALQREVQAVTEVPVALRGGCESRNYKLTASVDGAPQSFVLRIPLAEVPVWRREADGYPGDKSDLAREFRILQELRSFALSSPRVYGLDADGTHFGLPCFLMEFMPGNHFLESVFPAGDPLAPTQDRAIMRHYAECIARITRTPFQQNSWLAANLPKWPFDRAWELLTWQTRDYAKEPLLEYTLAWLRERQPAPTPFMLSHGDPNPSNFLSQNGMVCSIIDWENLSLVDHPLWAIGIFFGGYFGAILHAGLGAEYCEIMGIKPDEMEWFAVRGQLRDVFGDSGGRRWAYHMHWKAKLGTRVKFQNR